MQRGWSQKVRGLAVGVLLAVTIAGASGGAVSAQYAPTYYNPGVTYSYYYGGFYGYAGYYSYYG